MPSVSLPGSAPWPGPPLPASPPPFTWPLPASAMPAAISSLPAWSFPLSAIALSSARTVALDAPGLHPPPLAALLLRRPRGRDDRATPAGPDAADPGRPGRRGGGRRRLVERLGLGRGVVPRHRLDVLPGHVLGDDAGLGPDLDPVEVERHVLGPDAEEAAAGDHQLLDLPAPGVDDGVPDLAERLAVRTLDGAADHVGGPDGLAGGRRGGRRSRRRLGRRRGRGGGGGRGGGRAGAGILGGGDPREQRHRRDRPEQLLAHLASSTGRWPQSRSTIQHRPAPAGSRRVRRRRGPGAAGAQPSRRVLARGRQSRADYGSAAAGASSSAASRMSTSRLTRPEASGRPAFIGASSSVTQAYASASSSGLAPVPRISTMRPSSTGPSTARTSSRVRVAMVRALRWPTPAREVVPNGPDSTLPRSRAGGPAARGLRVRHHRTRPGHGRRSAFRGRPRAARAGR